MAREDESGEVCVRSPMLMRGYLGDAKATKDTIDEQGWLHTGDIGFIKQEKIYIVDRKKVRHLVPCNRSMTSTRHI